MKNPASMLDNIQPETASIVVRTWANSSTFSLVGRVANIIRRETKALAQDPSVSHNEIRAYSDMRDEAQDDNALHGIIGVEERLTLDLLVEYTAAIRGLAYTIASGFPAPERRYAQPQDVAGCFDFMATPKSRISEDQIEAVLEEEPTMSREEAIKLVQQIAAKDADALLPLKQRVLDRVEELLADAPDHRELDAIVADLPEDHRNNMVAKACEKVLSELDRTLPLAIKGVPGISAKRRVLKGDLPRMEALAA